jgi:C4-dicarboxylate-specific signal transduction histidine kinase
LLQHQAELAHALRLRTIGEMATGLAQHLRRPIIAIERAAHDCRQAIEAGRFDPAAFAQHVGQVTTEALGAADSLRHLRRLVRKHDSTRDGIDLNDVARNAARIVAAQHPDMSPQLVLAPDLPLVHADGIQLEQVVLNLLLNAVDAVQAVPADARKLAVQTTVVDGSAIEVAIQDSGAGLAPDIVDNLFTPFVTSKPEALGMGLAISRSIVEAHGGRIWVTPNPGGGSIFRFTVPLP